MNLKSRIQEDMKNAMRSGLKDELKVIRLILSSIKQIEIDKKITIDDDEQILDILNKMVKQRRDSISQFQKGEREDLAQIEIDEIKIINRYLPEELSESELASIISDAIEESNAEDIKNMGSVMSIIKDKTKGRADMSKVSNIVRERLTK
jgi:uncharacterized protein YqeY|tara:strand:- start:1248 stop:1697 length:450 start_codon:yes stop_codon:yes gene_type:complete